MQQPLELEREMDIHYDSMKVEYQKKIVLMKRRISQSLTKKNHKTNIKTREKTTTKNNIIKFNAQNQELLEAKYSC